MLKVGIQSAGWYDKNKPLESFEYIKSCGFEAVDINIDHDLSVSRLVKEGIYPTNFDKPIDEFLECYRALKEASETTGVTIGQMHAPFPCWVEGKDDVNEHLVMVLDKCFALCEYLSCPAVVVHPVRCESYEEEWEVDLALYRRLIPLIKKYNGVTICIENIFGRQNGNMSEGRFSNVRDLCRIIDLLNEESGGKYFGACLDVGHATLSRSKIKDFVKWLGDRLIILHIHDNNGTEDNHMIPYSNLNNENVHVCDWKGFVEGLKEINYDGVIAFETFRVFSAFPKPVHTEVLKLISAIGHYWKGIISEK